MSMDVEDIGISIISVDLHLFLVECDSHEWCDDDMPVEDEATNIELFF